MTSISFSIDLDTLNRVHQYGRTNGHKSLSASLTNLVVLGLAYTCLLDDQEKDAEGGQ